MLTRHLHRQIGPQRPLAPDLPASLTVLIAQIADLPVGGGAEAVALHATEGLLQALRDVLAGVVGHDAPTARDKIHQPLEGNLHRVQIGIDVGVIKLDVSQDQRIGKVVQELRSLVEEGGVVLVALNNEGTGGPQLKADAKILRHTANQKRRLKAGIVVARRLIDPGQHAGRGGLAVGSSNHQ